MTRTSKPATGNARWRKPQRNGNPTLAITPTGGGEQVYELEERPDGYRLQCLTHLEKTGEFQHYKLIRHRHTLLCDCPDATQRRTCQHLCKHVRGVTAALRKSF